MPKLRGEDISENNIRKIQSTLSDSEFILDIDKQKWYLVKVTMKPWVSADTWSFSIDRGDIMKDLFCKFERGELDELFDVAITEVSVDEIRQLLAQRPKGP
jgi:hypothetical protein